MDNYFSKTKDDPILPESSKIEEDCLESLKRRQEARQRRKEERRLKMEQNIQNEIQQWEKKSNE